MLVDNIEKINQDIQLACQKAARSDNDITMIAVTKSVEKDIAKELAELGIENMAENRVDKLLEKKIALKNFPSIKWHLIGNLQRRKVKSIINEIDYFHALDSLKLAEEIQKRAEKQLACFVEVNVTGEESKHGLNSDDVIAFIQQLAAFDKIKVVGLMTMAPLNASEQVLHEVFSKLKKLQLAVNNQHLSYAPCTELSMGMSNDFSIAIEEGATFVRIGTAIFRGA
ncbi:YggS family pyridoxal phosphate enzyme [Enterococcus plantarum]|uniref:Pyridoxal phosphate homeostasis protein n=1 Tax=Enterococcus plantarum TaxID=1077675 RepID=A0A2W3Z3V3_9ENTE|nr:YggS family pyridoxal phosphate-dependent enzyme [Enterococcus plantarum]MBO0422672.1 YggS family pyridoxal phosphate-dependent enzyme [Enterococcus plantarum]MBO0467719.1 YggS family pyridoxal phosphate-dependent enzyme [Enterococcus plantarum]OEG09325.1 YggS family pyridoxal phosphate enzyme [Enterococcus plantarum]PZL70997.1 YggS family pyridoxal phosphate-dependent enzyme [Enterococcus plantarum]